MKVELEIVDDGRLPIEADGEWVMANTAYGWRLRKPETVMLGEKWFSLPGHQKPPVDTSLEESLWTVGQSCSIKPCEIQPCGCYNCAFLRVIEAARKWDAHERAKIKRSEPIINYPNEVILQPPEADYGINIQPLPVAGIPSLAVGDYVWVSVGDQLRVLFKIESYERSDVLEEDASGWMEFTVRIGGYREDVEEAKAKSNDPDDVGEGWRKLPKDELVERGDECRWFHHPEDRFEPTMRSHEPQHPDMIYRRRIEVVDL